MIHRPSVILADEPTGSLDRDSAAAVINLLLGAQRDLHLTLLVVTHDSRLAARMDDRIALQDGRLVDGLAEIAPRAEERIGA
jgi:ABC-type lipoprotein export system ATPase subunit